MRTMLISLLSHSENQALKGDAIILNGFYFRRAFCPDISFFVFV